MDCEEARLHLLDEHRGRRDPELGAALRAHLEGCEGCRHHDAAERALTAALEKLPQHPASLALKRRLSARAAPARAARRPALRRTWTMSLAATVLAAVVIALLVRMQSDRADALAARALAEEALDDHLAILDGREPLAIVSSGIHEVKPWFAGKIDFAPVVAFAGDADFPLQGGEVESFQGRKAAVLVYKRRLHTLSVLVFRADGLRWPARGLVPLGHVQARPGVVRGFNAFSWRDGDLGYVVVSDLEPKELRSFAAKIAGP